MLTQKLATNLICHLLVYLFKLLDSLIVHPSMYKNVYIIQCSGVFKILGFHKKVLMKMNFSTLEFCFLNSPNLLKNSSFPLAKGKVGHENQLSYTKIALVPGDGKVES